MTRDSIDKLNEVRGLKVDDAALHFVGNSEAGVDPLDETLAHQSSHCCVIAERRYHSNLFQANRAINAERRLDV